MLNLFHCDKILKKIWAGSVAVIECLPNMCKAPGSIPTHRVGRGREGENLA